MLRVVGGGDTTSSRRWAPTPRAHPDALDRAAFLAGKASVPPDAARILLLGCGPGQDLLPIAHGLPGATVVGLEPDAIAREAAAAGAAALGLDDVELVGGLAGLEGRVFDYVLVPDLALRPGARVAPVLEAARSLLAPSGLLFFAHACAPGSLLRAEVAACLRAAASGAGSSEEAVALAREALEALEAHLPEDHPLGGGLAWTLAHARQLDDDALVESYLAPLPEACRRVALDPVLAPLDLAVVAELGPPPADPRLGRQLEQSLARFGEPAALGAWMDLLQLRDRRWVLLGPAGAPSTPPRFADQLAFGRFASPLRPSEPDPWLGPRAPVEFHSPEGLEFRFEHPIDKAALALLAHAWPRPLAFAELAERVSIALQGTPGAPPLDDAARAHLGQFMLAHERLGVVRCTRRALVPEPALSDAPRLGALTRLQAERGGPLTGPHHDPVPIDAIDAVLLSWIDGRPLAQLAEELEDAVRRGALTVGEPGEAWTPVETFHFVRRRWVELLDRLARHALIR